LKTIPKYTILVIEKRKILIELIEEINKMSKDIISEKLGYWETHAVAVKLYSKPKCFICDHKVKWGNIIADEYNGRMYNLVGSKLLIKEHWISICRSCLKRKILKEVLEEGIMMGGY